MTHHTGVRVGVPELSAPDFIGRQDELRMLREALSYPPVVALIAGEAGIGKTRLVDELLTSSAVARLAVIAAACPPVREPFTLGPVVDALRQTAERVGELRLSALAGALRPLFPEWAAVLPPTPEPLGDARAARHRLFRALAELLTSLGVGVLVVEDVHWADDATLEFLLFLVSQRPQPVSLVLTYRPEDLPAESLLLQLSSRLAQDMAGIRVELAALDVEETASLVSSMLGGEPVSVAFAAFLHDCCNGLPLAIEESVRLLRDRGDLRHRGREWVRRTLAELVVPATVRDAVLERSGRLGPEAQTVLRAAAVLNDPADEPIVLKVAGLPDDLARADLARAGLSAAVASRLLHEDDSGCVAFRHSLAAWAVYETIPAPERKAMHVRAGRALQELSQPPVARLARHFRAAGDLFKWCEYAEQAADLALASGDHKTAITLLHDLLTQPDVAAAAAPRLTQKIPAVALDGYGRVGELVRSLRSVLERGSLSLEQRGAVRSQLGRMLLHAGEYEAGRAELERALPDLAHRPADAARAMILLGWPQASLLPADTHHEWLTRAAGLVNDSTPPADRLALLVDRATALLQLGAKAGWAVAAELPKDGTNSEERQRIARGCTNLGEAATLWGKYDDARQRLTTALDLSTRHGYHRLREWTLATTAHLDWFTGAWTGLAERVTDLADVEDVDPLIRLKAMLVTGLLAAASGDQRSAERRLQVVLDEGLRRGITDIPIEPAAAIARLRLDEGRVDDALRVTDRSIEVISRKGIWLWATDVAPVRVRALTAAGCPDQANALVTEFARGLDTLAAPAPRAALAVCRALVADRGRRAAAAADLFRQASAAWMTLPRPYEALLAAEQQALCLLTASDDRAGLNLLVEVLRKLTQLGANADADRVAACLREHGVVARRAWRGGPRGYGDRLSPREVEVLQQLLTGRSNREIAEAVSRSRSTVAAQLNSAMRKLNVSSRTALAVAALEAGITPDTKPAARG